MEEYSLTSARKRLIAKRNDFIQESRYSLTKVQQQAILYLISKVQPDDAPGKQYIFRCKEFFALMKYKTNSYTDIKALLQSIRNISWWKDADNNDDDDILMTWFDLVRANEKKGTVTITFHQDIYPYILDLQRQKCEDGKFYTSYQLQNVTLMKGKYSSRMYEILKSYANRGTWTFENGTGSKHDLQKRLADVDMNGNAIIPAGWNDFYTFNRDVLKPCKKDINLYSDIKIDYEPIKEDLAGNKHRRYVAIKFVIVSKTPGELEETNKHIDDEYKEVEEYYYQMSVEESFKKEHEIKLNKEKEEKEIEKQQKKEEELENRIKKSRYPIVTEIYGSYFDDTKLKFIIKEALRKIEPGFINWENRELWIVDYIEYYYSLIEATEETTKTTPYNRLINSLRKDYDMYASKLNYKYQK